VKGGPSPAPEPLPVVLVVEDETRIRRFLVAGLESHGFRAVEAAGGEAALRLAVDHRPAVVVLDLGLPDLDGLEVLRRLREWSDAPVVVVSARGREDQKVAALEGGADDYLVKPFGFPELLARLHVALRHAARAREPAAGNLFEAGPLRVDLAARTVLVEGREVRLTPVEYDLLLVLVRHAGKVVTHRQLLETVWGKDAGDRTHYLRVYMTHLRKKLEEPLGGRRLFHTELGVGYRLRTDP
jgi:two-component system KDP operon response regulator KdpE